MTESLCESVKLHVEYNSKVDGDSTKADHLEKVEIATGKELIPEIVVLPEVEHLWSWFWELSQGRGGTGFGPAPLSFSEIQAWKNLLNIDILPWEVDVLKRMDAAYLEACSQLGQKDKETKKR